MTTAEAQTTASADTGTRGTSALHYLEIVTPDVDATCRTYERLHGAVFGEPVASLGNARLAPLPGDVLLAVRGPLRATERPVVRPYLRVKDLEASVAAAAASGAQIALPPMELPGHGRCAVFIQGGIEHRLWEAAGDVE